MSRMLLALGAAALAISTPAIAGKEGKGQAGGGNKGGQKAERGPGNGGGGGNGRGNDNREIKDDRDGGASTMRNGRDDMRGRGADKQRGDDVRKADKQRGDERLEMARDHRRGDDRARTADLDDQEFDRDDDLRVLARNFNGGFGRFDNCPPGLSRKDNGCLPPGQAKKYLGSRLQQSFADSRIPFQYRNWYQDDDRYLYRFGDGQIYRIDRQNSLIDGIIPLFAGGGYYALGDQWPSSYDFYNVPQQYRTYYADGGDYRYRYGDGAIYRVNSGSGAVEAIVALLAGDLGVGSRLPVGYDTYNVPFAYRDRYADSADNWYRYNDGYIYQVDPQTRLISAVIEALI